MATISDQPDIELVGEVVDEGELTEVVETGSTRCAHSGDERDPEESGPVRLSPGALSPDEDSGAGSGAEPRNLLLGHRGYPNQPLESSEAGILNAVRERPTLVGAIPN